MKQTDRIRRSEWKYYKKKYMIIHQILLRNPSVISSIREAVCSEALSWTDSDVRDAGITKQRKIILDIILQEECTCCKEIYFLASKKDPNIGMATIYRMINLLEEIGALKRKSAYRLCDEQTGVPICCVQLDDQTNIRLDNEKLCKIIEKGMESCGYLQSRRVSKSPGRKW